MRRTWIALLLIGSLSLTLFATFARYNDCTFHEWNDYYQYKRYCYSDVLPLWHIRHLDEDKIPYVDEFSEYPVGTGAITYLAARMSEGLHQYMLLTDFFLLFCGFLAGWAMSRSGLPWTRVFAYCISPALVAHAFVNWDLAAVALTALGWMLWRKGRAFDAAVFFGLGATTKVYPILFLPFLFLEFVFQRNVRGARNVVAGSTLGLVLPNLYVYLVAKENFLGIWKFHANRDPDFETPWPALQRYLDDRFTPEEYKQLVSIVGLVAVLATVIWLAYKQGRHRFDPLAAGAITVCVFLLVNRVYSPQYTLWVFPLLLALNVAWIPYWLYIFADFANYIVRYKYFTPVPPATEGWNDAWADWSRWCVLARWLLLLVATAHVYWIARRGSGLPKTDMSAVEDIAAAGRGAS